MTSKISFFDASLFRRALRRALLPMAFFFLLWLFILPISILRGAYSEAKQISVVAQRILEFAHLNGSILACFYGLATAWVINFYLFRTPTAYYQASLPMRRETVYVTNYLAGLSAYLIPAALIALLSVGACVLSTASAQVNACLQWLCIGALGYLFFFSFAFFLCVIVGHVAAMPVFYGVLNVAVIVLVLIVRFILSSFVYGLPESPAGMIRVAEWFSPVVYLLDSGVQVAVSVSSDNLSRVYFEGWPYLLAIAAAGLAFAVGGLFLYRVRHFEYSGDVIATVPLRPVFVCLFTVGCALVIGMILMFLFDLNGSFADNAFWLTVFCVLFGALLGFFLAQMMLQKTIKVFGQKKLWLRFVILAAALFAVMGAVKFDLFGYTSYVPDADSVSRVSLGSYHDGAFTDDPAFIDGVTKMHRRILREARNVSDGDTVFSRISIEYTLKSGRTVSREYDIIQNEQTLRGSVLEDFIELFDDPDYLILRSGLPSDVTAADIEYCDVYKITDGEWPETYLTGEQAYALYTEAILPDLQSSLLGRSDVGRFLSDAPDSAYDPCYEINIALKDHQYYRFLIIRDAKQTRRFLSDLKLFR